MSHILKIFRLNHIFKNFGRKYTLTKNVDFTSTIDSINVDVKHRIGYIYLNRPSVYNSLNLEMLTLIYEVVKRWTYDPYVTMMMILSSSENYCAGGDVKRIYKEGFVAEDNGKLIINYENLHYRKEFFTQEYQLLYALKNSKKPIFTIIKNTCIGGGMGLASSVNGIVMCYSTLSMPESQIGFFPDVGMMYLLSRFQYNLGVLLALTGMEIHPYDAVLNNVFPHITMNYRRIHHQKMIECAADPNVKVSDLQLLTFPLNNTFLRDKRELSSKIYLREQIMDVCSHDDMETILFIVRKLCTNDRMNGRWWTMIYESLMSASPLSLKVILRYIKMAKTMTYEEILKMDARVARRFMLEPDFYTAIHQKMILKYQGPIPPKWQYKYLDDVTDEKVDEFFKPFPNGEPDIALKPF